MRLLLPCILLEFVVDQSDASVSGSHGMRELGVFEVRPLRGVGTGEGLYSVS